MQDKSKDEDGERIDTSLKEAIFDIEESAFDIRAICGIMDAIDHRHYEPGYLLQEPHVRLQLRDFIGEIHEAGVDPESRKRIIPTVTLTLHKTGMAVLTIGVRFPGVWEIDQITRNSNSTSLKFGKTTLSGPIIQAMLESAEREEDSLEGEWADEILDGVRWRDFDHNEGGPVSLTDVAVTYMDALQHRCKAKSSFHDHVIGKTIFLEDLDCACISESQWMELHWQELASLLSRSQLGRDIRKEHQQRLIGRNFALTERTSMFAPGGTITEIAWKYAPESSRSLADYYDRVNLTENALIRLWLLRELDHNLDQMRPRRKALEDVLRLSSSHLKTISKAHLSYGDAREISDHILREYGGEQVLASVNSRISLVKDLVASKEAARSVRRTNQFAAAAMLAAVLLGLPAIKQSLDVLMTIPASAGVPGRGVLESSVKASGSIDALATYAYLTLLLIGFLVLLIGGIVFSSRRKPKQIRPGIRWGTGEMRVGLVSKSEEESFK
ncbi:hypothetical protein VA596_11355 [Amycolatopsis sp., V23-08]|uniref:Uncharacterized protein n=1 Tax=Amycolatopsis heterodermiae TaxID=3110235 RepID=A0ABU5R1R0_9PSEU|nr:hypothetical protein [Amycolatopsis sp., V23-08]MEA5360135.1 hypothetical protein [Amycolatopsis sp., V23-08]